MMDLRVRNFSLQFEILLNFDFRCWKQPIVIMQFLIKNHIKPDLDRNSIRIALTSNMLIANSKEKSVFRWKTSTKFDRKCPIEWFSISFDRIFIEIADNFANLNKCQNKFSFNLFTRTFLQCKKSTIFHI